jgi:hypothetical protein
MFGNGTEEKTFPVLFAYRVVYRLFYTPRQSPLFSTTAGHHDVDSKQFAALSCGHLPIGPNERQHCSPHWLRQYTPGQNYPLQIGVNRSHVKTHKAIILQRRCSAPSLQKSQLHSRQGLRQDCNRVRALWPHAN